MGPLDDPARLDYHWARSVQWTPNNGGTVMTWEAPDFVEVKMDAEINSYQDDFGGGDQDDRF